MTLDEYTAAILCSAEAMAGWLKGIGPGHENIKLAALQSAIQMDHQRLEFLHLLEQSAKPQKEKDPIF